MESGPPPFYAHNWKSLEQASSLYENYLEARFRVALVYGIRKGTSQPWFRGIQRELELIAMHRGYASVFGYATFNSYIVQEAMAAFWATNLTPQECESSILRMKYSIIADPRSRSDEAVVDNWDPDRKYHWWSGGQIPTRVDTDKIAQANVNKFFEMAVFPLNGSRPLVNDVDLLPLSYSPVSPKTVGIQTDLPPPPNPPLQSGSDSFFKVSKFTLHLLLEEVTNARDQLHSAIARQQHAVQTSRWRIGAYNSLLNRTYHEDGSDAGIPFLSPPGSDFPSNPLQHTPTLQGAGHRYSTETACLDNAPDSDSEVEIVAESIRSGKGRSVSSDVHIVSESSNIVSPILENACANKGELWIDWEKGART